MAFVGKLAYLFLFPGLLFILLAGLAARLVIAGMTRAVTRGTPVGPAPGLNGLLRLLSVESVATGGPLEAVTWIAPAVKLMALAWVSCILTTFIAGDLVLVFFLMLLVGAADLLMVSCSVNPRVRQNGFGEAAGVISWAVPMAFVISGVSLRIGEISVSGIIRWQAANGALVGSGSAGAFAQAGTVLLLAAALVCASCMARLRPLGRGMFDDPPGGTTTDLSGPPLAMTRMSDSVLLFVVPLLIAVLFFAGPSQTWYEVVFWALKVTGLIILLGIADLVSARARSVRALFWSLGAGGSLATIGLVFTWIGVSK